jgi:hypothetical protein
MSTELLMAGVVYTNEVHNSVQPSVKVLDGAEIHCRKQGRLDAGSSDAGEKIGYVAHEKGLASGMSSHGVVSAQSFAVRKHHVFVQWQKVQKEQSQELVKTFELFVGNQ